MSNEDAALLVVKHDDPQVAAKFIMEEAYARGSLDNICVMVIDLREYVGPFLSLSLSRVWNGVTHGVNLRKAARRRCATKTNKSKEGDCNGQEKNLQRASSSPI